MALAAHQLWTKRLTVPAYPVSEAARYARTTPQTINNWQRNRKYAGIISDRESGTGLSYLQLIEVGVVAAMRKSGVKLPKIKQTRNYMANELKSDFPFAEYRFKTDGRELFVSHDQLDNNGDAEKLVTVSENGQLAWTKILAQLLQEFEYDDDFNKVSAWRVGGMDSPIRIDPRISFGAPQVSGTPTWVLRERWNAGESVGDIAEDYQISSQMVWSALRFEGVNVDPDRHDRWVN
jgi:uncharacterized protein (DUF433 family)